MSCEDWEEHIYLYRELTAGEQAAVNRHVATCARCSALLEAVQQQGALVRQAAAKKPEVQDPARLADSIMAAIGRARRKHVVMDSAWLRYSMAAASALLLVAFFLEQPWADGHEQDRVAATPPPEVHSPVMNTRAFLEHQRPDRPVQQKSFFALYADCMQHNNCDNATVRHFKTKMKL
jgi:anti-sigma factor RsiW